MNFFYTTKTRRHKGALMVCLCVFVSLWLNTACTQEVRSDISLDKNWKTVANDSNKDTFNGFEDPSFSDARWISVDVPHNWDQYEGYRRLRHGNRHGYAWYRKTFTIKQQPAGKRLFLFFEGVGSYATVWLNGRQVSYHAGGRTTFTIDVTDVVKFSSPNLLAVRADHPANIQDLPWVCGGCSDDRGFSEGSQPMGIFRPAHLIITNDVRIEPFGVNVWNDATVSKKSAQLFFETEVKNYVARSRNISIINRLTDKNGKIVAESKSSHLLNGNTTTIIKQQPPTIADPILWSLENPYLYTVTTEVSEGRRVIDRMQTPYGIRSLTWQTMANTSKQFLLNGKPVFINGIAEYEHLLGDSHAFDDEEIRSRVMEIKSAGFNAFRDAHQPHNLRYQKYWDSLGLLWWTQMSAHDWYDTPEFRNNFKTLLKEWVKERRNSPSLVLWGLQNESKLPEDFAKECTELIREMDPTTSSQRLVTTCNGGSGTDWDVPQNWTGTYGGNPATYSEDLKKQILVGEYGAWRTLDFHAEGAFVQNGPYSEDRMAHLMEMKVRLGEAAKDSSAGHFMWLFSSHDNPGRVQGGEGYRELDRIGPVNYKGLLTPWGEPLDVYYMYRSNYVSKLKEPMVYIVSHTWPDRWTQPGKKSGIVVYSNCDEVELFNDVRSQSLGRKKRNGIGTHFQWDNVDIRYNVLYAVGYINGKEVAKDYIVLNHLPEAPHVGQFFTGAKCFTISQPGYNYLYRVNCGGGDYTDVQGNKWMADRGRKNNNTWGSTSWTKDFPGMPPFFASQRSTNDPMRETKDWKLFQSFRYGRDKLRYDFPVQDGEYLVELYFTEPWYGIGGGMDCTGWRLFDVAVNNKVVIKDLDIWKEAEHSSALKKIVKAKVTGGLLTISFPHVASGQAVISAIAIATLNKNATSSPGPESLMKIEGSTPADEIRDWLNTGDNAFKNGMTRFASLPPELFGAQWLYGKRNAGQRTLVVNEDADIFVAVDSMLQQPQWLNDFNDSKNLVRLDDWSVYKVYKKRMAKSATTLLPAGTNYLTMAIPASTMEPAYDLKLTASYKAVDAKLSGPFLKRGKVDGKDRVIFEKASDENMLEWDFSVGIADMYSLTVSYNNPLQQMVKGHLQLLSADGTLMKEEDVEFTATRPGKSNYISTTTGTMINAGNYKIRLTAEGAVGLSVNTLDVQ